MIYFFVIEDKKSKKQQKNQYDRMKAFHEGSKVNPQEAGIFFVFLHLREKSQQASEVLDIGGFKCYINICRGFTQKTHQRIKLKFRK